VADWTLLLTWTIFLLTYGGLALGRIPGLRTDRAGIALVGATLLLVTGVVTLAEATSPESIDYKTLILLFGMMIVVGSLRLAGFFERLTKLALRHIATPRGLLAVTIALAGVLSAFLINDVVCVALAPLVLHVARRLGFDPLPHLIGLATAANIGSTGTITGNPQNIYIGVHSGIAYGRFALRLMPLALVCLVVDFLVIALVYRDRLTADDPLGDEQDDRKPASDAHRAFYQRTVPGAAQVSGARAAGGRPERNNAASGVRSDKPASRVPRGAERNNTSKRHARLQAKAVTIALAAVVLFFAGLPLELVALGAAGLTLLDRVNPRKIYREVDWSLLVMFAGLFVVVHAFQMHVVAAWHIDRWHWLLDRPVDLLSLVSAGLSNVVSNVPAVLLLEPVVQAMPAADRETAWLALAMSSTLAGNLTVLGSVANLIVVESAAREGFRISFWEYCRAGIPVTLLTLALGVAWLEFVRY